MGSMRIYFALHVEKNGTILFTSVFDMDITESTGYRDFVWAVELHRLGMEMIGLWPKTDKFIKKYQWLEFRVGIILILLIIIFLPTMCTFMNVWGNMVLVIDSLHIALPMVTIIAKYVVIRWKRTVLFAIINMMAEDWIAFKHFTERTVMIRRARSARLIMIIGYIFAVIGFLTVTIPPYFGIPILHTTNFMNRSKLLPLATYHFYDTDKSPQYEMTFLIHTISILLATTIYMSIDIFLVLIILHTCGQLEIFRCRLVSLVVCKNFNKVLNNIIATHVRLIRFAENIDNMYSLMMLIMILYFGIVFCLNGFLLTVFLINKKTDKVAVTEMYYTTIFLISLLMNTFLYCGAGELITEQSNSVHRALCDLEWYKLESRKARNLILLMIRTNHPFRVTAGKVIPLTLATFCSLLKTSSGYISFLLRKHN
ncbi:odorant receptor 13a-like isoform X2 [Temnothorax longispinosus]|uniref:odorant receptor 13a-like isoform X2 n=1 Tax=Temnothorax longispinosus TaxID=300112 RepID=UPI003A9924CF